MAKPGELAALIASQFGAEEPTVRQQARVLRDAGLMSKEKAGRGAGTLTARDAAHLLVAVAGTRSVGKSVSMVQRPGGLVTSQGGWNPSFVDLPELSKLPVGHTFVDAVEALVAAAISGSLQKAATQLEGGPVDLVADAWTALSIEITVLGPLPRGSVLIEERIIDDQGDVRRFNDHFERRFYADRSTTGLSGNLARFDIASSAELRIDLISSMTFTHRTLAAIGELFQVD